MSNLEDIFSGISQKNRRSLSKAITLIESQKVTDKEKSLDLLKKLPFDKISLRVGISGPPGAGKSTFIDHFGSYLISQGKSVAVLAIDPSTPSHPQQNSGGSLLGDKTRMEQLSKHKEAFIRPSPSGSGTLGGVSSTTGDVLQILEAASYNVIFLESIGTGQNEIDVTYLCDLTILLLPPASGDALQGVKRGITEKAHIIVVNKDDGVLSQDAFRTFEEYKSVLRGTHQHIFKVSSTQETGFKELWVAIQDFWDSKQDKLKESRRAQSIHHFQRRLELEWPYILKTTPFLQDLMRELSQKIQQENLSPRESCENFYKIIKSRLTNSS